MARFEIGLTQELARLKKYMRYSGLTQRIAGESAAAWQIHNRALQMREQGVDVLLLSVGDPDFNTPSPIVQAAIDSLLAGDTH